MDILQRNEQSIFDRLLELTEVHIKRIEGINSGVMTNEEKIKIVLEYFNQATDKDNPLREVLQVDEEMYGKMFQTIQSYDLMDN